MSTLKIRKLPFYGAPMRKLILFALLLGPGCTNDTLTVRPDGASPLCIWHFDVPGFTSDSDETPAAQCSYILQYGNTYTFTANVPGRFSLEYTTAPGGPFPVVVPDPKFGHLDVTGGCAQWDARTSYVQLESYIPRVPGDLMMLDVHASCPGFTFEGFVGRRKVN